MCPWVSSVIYRCQMCKHLPLYFLNCIPLKSLHGPLKISQSTTARCWTAWLQQENGSNSQWTNFLWQIPQVCYLHVVLRCLLTIHIYPIQVLATLLPISVKFGNLTNFVVRNCTLQQIVYASGYGVENDLSISISQWQLENLFSSDQQVYSLISIVQDYQEINTTIIDSISYVNGSFQLFYTSSAGVYQFSNIYAENIQGSTTSTTSFPVFSFGLSSNLDGHEFNMEFTNITCQGWDFTFGSSSHCYLPFC